MTRKAFRPTENFHYLLVGLIVFTVLHPLVADIALGGVILDVALLAMLIATAVAFSGRRKVLLIILALAIPAFVLRLSGHLADSLPLTVALQASVTVFFAYLAMVLIGYALAPGKVTGNRISAALITYLLIGTIWASLFTIVELLSPGSVQFPGLTAEGVRVAILGDRELADMTYYSFVTLTTLGYGDVLPVTPMARTLAWVEAIVGQMFLTVLVARLVALHISHSKEDVVAPE